MTKGKRYIFAESMEDVARGTLSAVYVRGGEDGSIVVAQAGKWVTHPGGNAVSVQQLQIIVPGPMTISARKIGFVCEDPRTGGPGLECASCRHFQPDGGLCRAPSCNGIDATICRRNDSDCGPLGKYWAELGSTPIWKG